MQGGHPAGTSRRFAPWLLASVVAYIGFMLWSDRNYQLGEKLAASGWVLAGLLPLVFGSFVLRYVRWRLLLRHGKQSPCFLAGLVAYLAGFALTASPGKAGELIRVRYFARLGVPADLTVAAFVAERACDLVVVLGLALLVASQVPGFGLLAGTILGIIIVILFLARTNRALRSIQRFLQRHLPRWLSRPTAAILRAIARLRSMLSPAVLLPSLAIGAAAWLLTSLAFVLLCESLGLGLPRTAAFGIYPAAMLVGALSFMPGGIGTTEAATVALLVGMGVTLPEALAVAVGIRLTTLWFATLIGGACVGVLDRPAASRVAGT